MPEGGRPLRVPASRRYHTTHPHSRDTRVLPHPPPGPMRLRHGSAVHGLTLERRTKRGPVAGVIPGASGAGLPGRSALLAASSSLSSAESRPPGGSGSLRSSRPGGTGAHATGSAGAPPPPSSARPPTLSSRARGPRFRTRGSSGRSGTPALPPAPPSRARPLSEGVSLVARGRQGLWVRGGGGRVGPRAAGGGAAVDRGTDAGAAPRPLAMALGGRALRTSPPRCRHRPTLAEPSPSPGPACRPAPPPPGRPPGGARPSGPEPSPSYLAGR